MASRERVRPTNRSRADVCVVSSGEDANDLEGVSLTHEAISTSAVVPPSEMRGELLHCASFYLEAGGALTRRFDRVTHMLVISSSVGMLNGIQRTTSDLRPATSFKHEMIDCALVPIWNSCPLQGQAGNLPAGTYSSTVVPASRIPTKCVGGNCQLL